MYTRDTIAAIATPLGSGGIGIIRLSGPDALSIAAGFFRSPGFHHDSPRSRHLHCGIIFDPQDGSDLDEALVCYMKAPCSYTGEDVVEVNCHSGVVLLEKILRMALAGGARLAAPGEFTRRAFLNGRMDLTRAEAVIDVIEAKSELGLKIASRQLTGSLGRRIAQLRGDLLSITAEVEAAIDFPEDDTAVYAGVSMAARVAAIAHAAAELADTYNDGCLYKNGILAVIAGKPNVGKSSLLNAILGDDRAIVTATPGTTRDIVQETVTMCGIPVRLLDTAGLHDSDHAIEKLGMERARAKLAEADIVLMVLDATRPLDSADRSLAALLTGKKHIAVINKTDAPAVWKPATLCDFLSPDDTIAVSALHHAGIDVLKNALAHLIGSHRSISPSDILIANARHRVSLEASRTALHRVLDGFQEDLAPELVAVDLHAALGSLGEITGETASADDILNLIFSRFCIGK